MAIEIRVPPLGESVVEATVGRWTKGEGDPVAKDEILVELETDKITVEVAAESSGVLGKIEKQEGASVGVNELLGHLEEGAGAAPDGGSGDAQQQPPRQPPPASEPVGQPGGPRGEGDAASAAEGGQTSPAVRAIAAEHGLDLAALKGSGPNGRVTKEDVLKAAEAKTSGSAASGSEARQPAPDRSGAGAAPPEEAAAAAPASPPPSAGERETRERMSRRRQTIARRLVEAQQTTASLTTFNEVDLSRVMDLRKRRQESFVEKYGIKIGFMSFFTKAVIAGLRQFPRLNAEIQGDEIVLKQHYDIGIAVGTEEGLVVPVIRDADQMNFAQIERTIGELAVKARDGKLALPDLQGGTFTITNGGTYGSMLSTPILNPPQVGILGMHNIVERAMVIDGKVEVRPVMYLALTYDHRIVDGSEAVRFLVSVKEMLEDPASMLIEG
ncbi:2-oxoglutarate dehydrogenase complex dihydrolipoyllysine-residue succinyltransferase [soil metagenome]